MNEPGDHFLAHAAFAGDQHFGVRARGDTISWSISRAAALDPMSSCVVSTVSLPGWPKSLYRPESARSTISWIILSYVIPRYGGGGGSRTRVREYAVVGLYMRSRS